jgi:HlyD family secretion protein
MEAIKSKWIWWSVGALTLLIVLGATVNLVFFNEDEIIEVKTSKVESKKISSTTLASGIVVPASEESIFLDTTKGKPDKIKVKEGQVVKKGDPLFSYENDELNLQLNQHEIAKKRILVQLEQQNEKIKDLENDIQKAKADNLPRETILQLTKEKEELEYQNRISNLDYQETLIQVQSIEEKQKQMNVLSPISGVIKEINEDAGMNGSQNPYIYIVSEDPYNIKGTVTEYDYNFLKEGQTVTIKPKALPNKSFKGKINRINNTPVKEAEGIGTKAESVTSYPFSIAFDKETDELQVGYHVSIEIEIQVKEATLVIPEGSIRTVEGKSFVFTVTDGVVKMNEVVIGETHGEWKEVVSGLEQGDTVVINKLDQLSDNMEVTVE